MAQLLHRSCRQAWMVLPRGSSAVAVAVMGERGAGAALLVPSWGWDAWVCGVGSGVGARAWGQQADAARAMVVGGSEGAVGGALSSRSRIRSRRVCGTGVRAGISGVRVRGVCTCEICVCGVNKCGVSACGVRRASVG